MRLYLTPASCLLPQKDNLCTSPALKTLYYTLMLNKLLFPQQESKANRLILIFSLIVSALAIAMASIRQVGTFGVESDFYGVYALQAERILSGETYTYQHNPPGYCLLLAAVTWVVGDAFTAGKLISVVSLFILTLLVYRLFKHLFDYSIAFLVTILTTLTLFSASFLAATDICTTCLIILCIYLLIIPSSLSRGRYFLLGLTAATAYLFRTNAIFLVIGIIIFIILINYHQEKIKQRLTNLVIFSTGLIIVLTPWLIYNWQVNGNAFGNTAYLQIAAHFYHPYGDNWITSIHSMESEFSSLSDVILTNPKLVFTTYFQDILFLNIVKLFIPLQLLEIPYLQIIAILPFLWISIGLFSLINDLRRRPVINSFDKLTQSKIIIFLIINLLGYLILGLVGFHRRYYFFLYPLVFLLKIYPFQKCLFRLCGDQQNLSSIIEKHGRRGEGEQGRGKRELERKYSNRNNYYKLKLFFSKCLIISLLLGILIATGVETYLTIKTEPRYLLPIATAINQGNSREKIMIVRKPHLAYLANLQPAFPLAATTEEYLTVAREIGADYLVYSDYEASLWPGLQALKQPEKLAPEFQLIYQDVINKVLVYQRINHDYSASKIKFWQQNQCKPT